MIVGLIVIGYLIVLAFDFPPIFIKKNKKQTIFYLILMTEALALNIIVVKGEELPSLAAVIKVVLSPILKAIKVLT